MEKKLTYLSVFHISKAFTALALLLSLLSVAVDVLIRMYAGDVINHISDIKARAVMQIILLAILYMLCKFFLPYFNARLNSAVVNHIYARLEEKALLAEQRRIDTVDAGTASTFFTSDISGVVQYVQRILSRFVPDTMTLVLSLIAVLILNPILGVVTLLSATVPAGIMTAVSRQTTERNVEYHKTVQSINNKIADDLYNLEFIKANQIEGELIGENEAMLAELLEKKKRLQFTDSIISSPAMLTSFLATLVVSLLGGYLVTRGSLEIGTLFTVISLIGFVTSPVMSLGNSLTQIRRVSANFKRLNGFFALENEAPEAENYVSDRSLRPGSLEVKNITFGYGDRKVLKDYSVAFHKGAINVIVGENGAGKSTLLKLLGDIYASERGHISVNLHGGILQKQTVREAIVIDPQESALFADTILGNLTRNNPTEMERVYKACEDVGIHSEILNMTNGYETLLNADGNQLSGGQKRRLCLARSLLRKARIYIFDEPTTGIDPECIKTIIAALRRLSAEHLVVAVSHEPLLIQASEVIVRMRGSDEN